MEIRTLNKNKNKNCLLDPLVLDIGAAAGSVAGCQNELMHEVQLAYPCAEDLLTLVCWQSATLSSFVLVLIRSKELLCGWSFKPRESRAGISEPSSLCLVSSFGLSHDRG